MNAPKRKHGISRLRTGLFVVLWACIYMVAYFGLNFIMPFMYRLFQPRHPDETRIIVVSLAVPLGAMAQVQLVERLLKQSMRGWIAYSMVGALLAYIAFNSMVFVNPTPFDVFASLLGLMLPAPLFQTVWLWKRIRSAWIWSVTPIVTALIFLPFVLQFWATGYDDTIMVMLIAANSLIQGGVMRYLWTHEKVTEKAKIEFATDEEEERAQRLQENEAAVLASISDAQGSQQRDLWRF